MSSKLPDIDEILKVVSDCGVGRSQPNTTQTEARS